MAKHWMQKAFANSHGQFKAKAKAAGSSTRAYAEAHRHSKGRLGRQARLALAGMKASHRRKK
jgi:hypothetical protein